MLLLFPGCFSSSCSKKVAPQGSSASPQEKQASASVPSAPCIIYKTKSDYAKYVPVMLSEDKLKIVSYPDIKDVYYKGKLAYPTQLADGFLLDNRGIGPDVAFLSVTYEKYRDLPKTPTMDELMNLILEKDPITEMYQCGNRSQYADPEKELNDLISGGNLNKCKKLR
jgi:hypothetical protein